VSLLLWFVPFPSSSSTVYFDSLLRVSSGSFVVTVTRTHARTHKQTNKQTNKRTAINDVRSTKTVTPHKYTTNTHPPTEHTTQQQQQAGEHQSIDGACVLSEKNRQ